MFVYLQTRSELLRDPDRLRELSLDLSTKNGAVPTVSAIVALLVDLMNDQVFSLQREGQIYLGRFAVLKVVVDR